MFESLKINELPESNVGIIRKPSNTRPTIWLVEENGVQAAVKDFSRNGFFFRNVVGRFLIWRERKAYSKLKGIQGIPRLYRVIEGLALVLEHIPGKNVEELKVEWGTPTLPDMIDEKLATGKYTAVTLVYNETSTGLTNPVYEISKMMKEKYPDVLVFVDAVSAMVGLPLHFDELGWDVVFASVQKAFAIPPGLAVAAVSNRALEKSSQVPDRGYYFDFQNFAKMAAKNQTPTTPAIPHIMALNYQCEKLLKEGMENVWERHKQMADFVRGWAKEKYDLFCDEKYASNTLTTVKNTKGINVAETISKIQEKHNTIFGNGYGKLKEQTFRIAHMGDITLDDIKELLGWIDEETA